MFLMFLISIILLDLRPSTPFLVIFQSELPYIPRYLLASAFVCSCFMMTFAVSKDTVNVISLVLYPIMYVTEDLFCDTSLSFVFCSEEESRQQYVH